MAEDETAVTDLVLAALGDNNIVASEESDELTLGAGLVVEICVLLQQLHQSFGVRDLEALVVEDAKVAYQAVVGHLIRPPQEVERVGLGEQSLPYRALIGRGQMAVWTEERVDEDFVRAVGDPDCDCGARGQECVRHSD